MMESSAWSIVYPRNQFFWYMFVTQLPLLYKLNGYHTFILNKNKEPAFSTYKSEQLVNLNLLFFSKEAFFLVVLFVVHVDWAISNFLVYRKNYLRSRAPSTMGIPLGPKLLRALARKQHHCRLSFHFWSFCAHPEGLAHSQIFSS